MRELSILLWLLVRQVEGLYSLYRPSYKLHLVTSASMQKGEVENSQGLNIVVLPGFGNAGVDYLNPRGMGEDFGMISALRHLGHSAEVVPITRLSWLRIARGVTSRRFWTYDSEPQDLFSFYLKETERTVLESFEKSGGQKVTLVGHSAGGWLARAILGDGDFNGDRRVPSSDVCCGLISLGTPHFPPSNIEADMTRGCLRFVDKCFPGTHLKNRGISYTSVGSGEVLADKSANQGTRERFAHQSYTAVIGEDVLRGEAGDGVVPLSRMHLPGAHNITLPGVYHSIDAPRLRWYGGPEVITQWLS